MTQTKKVSKEIETIGNTVDKCSQEILKYTPQLYTKKPGETNYIVPDPNASGVLIAVLGQYFLITSGHVLEDHDPLDIGIMIGSTFYILNGRVTYEDTLDTAVWKLDDEVAKELAQHYKFLPMEKIDFDHTISPLPKYLIVGFPWRKTVLKKAEKKLIVRPLIFLTKEAKKEWYPRLKFEEHAHLLLDYRQKKVKNFDTGLVQQNTSPQGVSGCGVWYIPNFLTPEGSVPDFKLIGQVIEQDDSKTILTATRIHLVSEILRTKFGLALPASNITRLR